MRIKHRRISPTYALPELHAMAPRVTMLGRGHAYVENHKGIREMNKATIGLTTAHGELRFEGANLAITRMSPSVITLQGDIRAIKWCEEC